MREEAYITAGLAPGDANELSEDEFNQLARRIINAATTNTTSNDAICATVKALGVLIGFSARRHGSSFEELLKFGQDALAEFAQEGLARIDQAGGK